VAGRLAAELPGAIWANQFDNTANRDGHYATTGPEIWQQTDGRLDAFVASSGTGGTIGGVSRYLKEQRPSVRVVLADPQGSALYRWIKFGELKAEGPGSITEGIGIGRITANFQDSPIDDALHIPDAEAVATVYRLLREDGLFVGSASGVNVAGAIRVARELGPGHIIATILCDSGTKYQSRLFNPQWLASKGLAAAARGD
jgi:cysteine synthase A